MDRYIPAFGIRYYCTGTELGFLDNCECLYSSLDRFKENNLDAVGHAAVSWYKISLRADCVLHNIDKHEFSFHVY